MNCVFTVNQHNLILYLKLKPIAHFKLRKVPRQLIQCMHTVYAVRKNNQSAQYET